MANKADVIVAASFALPLLSTAVATDAAGRETDSSSSALSPIRLTERALDNITAGSFDQQRLRKGSLPTGRPIKDLPPTVTTMAIGEEGGYFPVPCCDPDPIVTPIPEPPTVTTMAVGEEGGWFPMIEIIE